MKHGGMKQDPEQALTGYMSLPSCKVNTTTEKDKGVDDDLFSLLLLLTAGLRLTSMCDPKDGVLASKLDTS